MPSRPKSNLARQQTDFLMGIRPRRQSESSISSTLSSTSTSSSSLSEHIMESRKRGRGKNTKGGRKVKVRFDVDVNKTKKKDNGSSDSSHSENGPNSSLVDPTLLGTQSKNETNIRPTKAEHEKLRQEKRLRREARKKNEAALGIGVKKAMELQEDFLFSVSPRMLKKHQKQGMRFITENEFEEAGQSSSDSDDLDTNGEPKYSAEELKVRSKRRKERKRRKREAEEEEERKRSKLIMWYSRKPADYATDSEDSSVDSYITSDEDQLVSAAKGNASGLPVILALDITSPSTAHESGGLTTNFTNKEGDAIAVSKVTGFGSFTYGDARKRRPPGRNPFVPNIEKGICVQTSYFHEFENANEIQALRLGIYKIKPNSSPSKSKTNKDKHGKANKRNDEEHFTTTENHNIYSSNDFNQQRVFGSSRQVQQPQQPNGKPASISNYSTQPFVISSLIALFNDRRGPAVKDDLIDVSSSHSDGGEGRGADDANNAEKNYRKRKKRPIWNWLSGGGGAQSGSPASDEQALSSVPQNNGAMGSAIGSGGGYDSDDEGKTFSRLMRTAAGSNTGALKTYTDAYFIDHPDVVGERRRHIVSAPSYRLSIITFAEDETIKRELNEQFVLQHPSLEAKLLKLTHIRRIKMELLHVAIGDPNSPVDISTIAHAIWYFERLVEAQRVTKSNRKTVAAVCLLLAIKFWETGLVSTSSKKSLKAKIQYGIDKMEQRLGVNPKKAKESEFRVYAALDFSLLATTSAVKKHILRLLQVMHMTPSEYYKGS